MLQSLKIYRDTTGDSYMIFLRNEENGVYTFSLTLRNGKIADVKRENFYVSVPQQFPDGEERFYEIDLTDPGYQKAARQILNILDNTASEDGIVRAIKECLEKVVKFEFATKLCLGVSRDALPGIILEETGIEKAPFDSFRRIVVGASDEPYFSAGTFMPEEWISPDTRFYCFICANQHEAVETINRLMMNFIERNKELKKTEDGRVMVANYTTFSCDFHRSSADPYAIWVAVTPNNR